MKKILSVLLAVMMIFGSLAVGVSAADGEENQEVWLPGMVTSQQRVLVFDFNAGKSKSSVPVYNSSIADFEMKSEVTGVYRMLPTSSTAQKPGTYVYLPSVTPPEGSNFDGWYVEAKNSPTGYPISLTGGSMYYIPEGADAEITFIAWYSPAEVEADTLDTIMGILVKVFGAIIGILMYGGNTEAGVAMMEKVLGGLDL